MLRIRLLGGIGVEGPGSRSGDLSGSSRAGSLLAWLALNPGSHPRTGLASRFWPDVLDSSARASLRTALWEVRRAIGEDASSALDASRDRVGLDGAKVWVDVAEFDEHLDAGRFDEALALSRGELLAGLDDEWVFEYRDAHRERLGELFEGLAERAESDADLTGAVAWSRRRASLDPLAEDAHRALFTRLAASGDRAGAVTAYDRFRTRLLTEIGISPSEETRALVQSLRQGLTDATPSEARMPEAPAELPHRLAQAAASPWVGREVELGRLTRELEQARRGDTRLMMITGEGGIGKTRLVAALSESAEGCGVLYGRCDEDELVPFGPFAEMLGEHLARLPDGEVLALLNESGPELARLVPDLTLRFPGMGDGPHAVPDTERARLFSAVASVIARLAGRYPLVCVIDDLHWADRSSLLLAKYLARSSGLGGALLLGTYRDTELRDDHPLLELLADLERDRPVERIRLTGLGDDELTELAGARGHQLDAGAVRAIQDESQGNPFFVSQLLRHREEGGRVSGSGGDALPAGLRDVVVRRVASLPGAAGEVLRSAAAIGRDFDLEVLERVTAASEEETLDALDAAIRGGIIVEIDSTPGRYSFVHALLRTILENELSATRAARLHGRIGEAIERIHAGRLDDHLGELARHFALAGPALADRAVEYSELAAEQATARLAHEEAARLLDIASSTYNRQADATSVERARLLLALGEARQRAGFDGEARQAHAEAAEAARTGEAPELLARAALGHCGGAWDHFGTPDPASARLLGEALEVLSTDDSALRAQITARLVGVLYHAGEPAETTTPMASEALAMAQRVGDPDAVAAALVGSMFASWRPGMADERLRLAQELLGVTEQIGSLEATAQAHAWMHGAFLELCRREEADAARAAHAGVTRQSQLAELALLAAAFRSTQALIAGRWSEAEAAMRDVLDLGERSSFMIPRQFYAAQMVALLAEQLRLGEMLEHLRDLAREVTGFPGWRIIVAWAHAQAGDSDLALTELADLRRDGFTTLPWDVNYAPSVMILGLIAAEISDPELAAELEPRLVPVAENWSVMGVGGCVVGPAAYALGQVRLLQGRPEPAAVAFEQALALSRSMRARPYEAHSLLGLSVALIDTDAERASELREQALAIAKELGGMDRLLRDANAA